MKLPCAWVFSMQRVSQTWVRLNDERTSSFADLQLGFKQARLVEGDSTGFKATSIVGDIDLQMVVHTNSMHGSKTRSSVVIDIEQGLRDGVRDSFGNLCALFGLLQVVAQTIQRPQVCLYFEWRLRVERGQVLAYQLLQVQAQP